MEFLAPEERQRLDYSIGPRLSLAIALERSRTNYLPNA